MDRNYMQCFVVKNPEGMHGRPCTEILSHTESYEGDVTFRYGEKVADGKSIMQLLCLGVPFGKEVSLEIRGAGAKGLAEKIIGAINSK